MKIFRELCYCQQPWQVWADVITVMACSIANAVDRTEPRYTNREQEYAACINRLGGVEKPAELFALVAEALEDNSDQDFLGALYMELDLGNHWKGQFFTPYHVSQAMAEMIIGDCQEQIDQQGWISVCDPCVGGGTMLIAAANTFRRREINYQSNVLFIGQDIDRVVGMMAYIQMSLLGCPGYIVIANSITNPIVGTVIAPVEQEGQEFWYTPFYFLEVWSWRRKFSMIGDILSSPATFDQDDVSDISPPTYDVDLKEDNNGQLQFNF